MHFTIHTNTKATMCHLSIILFFLYAVSSVTSLPIISQPLENNPDHLVWEALLTIDTRYADQDKTRKIPKSIFITPNLNESKISCMPGHKLGPDGKCYKTLNIDPLDILKTQIASLFGQNRNKTTTPVVDYDEEYDYSDYGDSTESINNKYEVPLSLGFADDHRPSVVASPSQQQHANQHQSVITDDHKIILGDVISDREPFLEQQQQKPFLIDPIHILTTSTTSTTTPSTTTTTTITTTTNAPITTRAASTTTSTATAELTEPNLESTTTTTETPSSSSSTSEPTIIIVTEPNILVRSSTISDDSIVSTISNNNQVRTVPVEGSTESATAATLNDLLLLNTTTDTTEAVNLTPTILDDIFVDATNSSVLTTETPLIADANLNRTDDKKLETIDHLTLSSITPSQEFTLDDSNIDGLVASASSIYATTADKNADDEEPLSSENSVNGIFDAGDYTAEQIETLPYNRKSDRLTDESNSVDRIALIQNGTLRATTTEDGLLVQTTTETISASSLLPPFSSSSSISMVPLLALALRTDDANENREPMPINVASSTINDDQYEQASTEIHLAPTSESSKKSNIYEYITAEAAEAAELLPNTEVPLIMEAISTQSPIITTSKTTSPLSLLPSITEPNITQDTDDLETENSDYRDDEDKLDFTTTPINEDIEIIRRMDSYRDDDGGIGVGAETEEANLNAQLVDESFFQGSNMMLLANMENDTSTQTTNDSSETGISTITPPEITTDVNMTELDADDDTTTITDQSPTIIKSTTYEHLMDSLVESGRNSHIAGLRPDQGSSQSGNGMKNHSESGFFHSENGAEINPVTAEAATESSTVLPSSTTRATQPSVREMTEKSDVNIKLGINCYLKNYLKHFYIMCT